MGGRYRPPMDSKRDQPQSTEPVWNERHGDAEVIRLLKKRISELEAEIKAYKELLAELPDVLNAASNSGWSP